jgi:hypothetical protein
MRPPRWTDGAGRESSAIAEQVVGAVVGPRASGQQWSTTVPSGQPNRQLLSRIGRDGAAGLYMACKGSAVPLIQIMR